MGVVFEQAVSFLQPGYAHTVEQKRRDALRMEQIGDGAPAIIDLDAGIAWISPRSPQGPAVTDSAGSRLP